MSELSGLAQKLHTHIGMESPPLTEDIERGAIRRFIEAINGTDSLSRNDEDLIAPPTFLCSLKYLERLSIEVPLPYLLAAGDEFHFYKSLRPGDRITSVQKLVDIYEKTGRVGLMLFVVRDTTFVNQDDELVAVLRHTSIHY